MKKTTNYNLSLYEVNDLANLTDGYNASMNKLDSTLKTVSNQATTNKTNITSEVTRAKGAESTLTTNLNAEITRAKGAESTLTTNLNAEITRAKGAESTLTTNLNAEITRAKAAEKVNADAIAKINTTPTVHLAATINRDNKKTVDVYWTNDFVNYNKLTSFVDIFTNIQDFIYLNKIGKYYYIFGNDQYVVSSDFVNWTVYNISISSIMPNTTVWGYKLLTNVNKAIACVKIGTGATNRVGDTTYYFQPYVCTYTQAANGTLTFSDPTALTPPNYTKNKDSLIDVDVMFYNGAYYIAFKDEINLIAKLYKATDITNTSTWAAYTFTNNFWGYEAPKFCVVEGKVSLVVSFYYLENFVKTNITITAGSTSYTNIINTPAIFYDVYNNPQTEYISLGRGVYKNRHLGIMKCDFNILSKYVFTVVRNYEYPFTVYTGSNTTCTYKGPVIPNLCFTVSGSSPNVTINLTSISDFRNYKNPETNAMYLSSNSGYKPSIILTGLVGDDYKNKNIAKTASETPTGYDVYASAMKKIAINCNVPQMKQYTLY